MPNIMLGKQNVFQNGFTEVDERIQFWLDASDASTVTTNANDAITSLNEKSQNQYSATKVGAGTTPKYGVTTLNGLNTIRLYGDGRILSFGNVLNDVFVGNSAKFTAFQIFRNNGPDTSNETVYAKYGDNNQNEQKRQINVRIWNDEPHVFYAGDLSAFPSRGISGDVTYGTSNFRLTSYTFDATQAVGSRVDFREGGSDVTESTVLSLGGTPDGIDSSNAFFTVGGYYGTTGSTANPIDGNVAEIRIYNEKLSTTEIQNIETDLINKWGL